MARITKPKTASAPWDWNSNTDKGPFDLIGDVHGCMDELIALFAKLGYEIEPWRKEDEALIKAAHPDGRKLVFVGDLCDRGPNSRDVLRLAMGMIAQGSAMMVVGNHDDRLRRYLKGNKVSVSHGLETTVAELEACSAPFRERVYDFLSQQSYYLSLDRSRLLVAHAGIEEGMIGRESDRIRAYCLYGPIQGPPVGNLPNRYDWAPDHDADFAVAYGHTPNWPVRWRNNTINLDGGCVFGGSLVACRWPERELVHVNAYDLYYPGKTISYLPDI